MECLTEFTCSVFVDGELPGGESASVVAHLENCRACRAMVDACREEQRLLVACIQEIDLTAPVPMAVSAPLAKAEVQARPADIAKFGGILIGLCALIRLAMSSPENFVFPSLPASLDWLDPTDLSGRLSWLGGALSYLADEGVSGMLALMNNLSVVMLFVLLLGGVGMLVRRSRTKGAFASMLSAFGAVALVVAVAPSSSYAMEVRANADKQNQVVLVAAGEVIDDSLFAVGQSVTIDGTITGDLIAFASQVTIRGTVNGNIITGARNVDIQGTVGGSILAAGTMSMQVNGKVTHNLLGFGLQSVSVGKEGNVGGDFAAFSSDTHMNGNVAHNFYSYGVTDISGSVGRNTVFNGESLSVLPSARIGGNLTSYVENPDQVHIDAGSVIGGKQRIEIKEQRTPKHRSLFSLVFGETLHVAAAFLTGFVLLLLFPAARRIRFAEAVTILKSAGVGFLAVVAIPIASFILLITLIGIPVALIGFLAWFLGLYLAKITVANFIGQTLMSRYGNGISAMALGLLVGLVLVFVAINLPYIGGLIHFVLALTGLGGLIISFYRSYQSEPGSGI